jgi:hypothetical protein
MKEHPILFSTPMVQAILEGRKTQTRRICKHQHWTHSELTDVNINKRIQKVDRNVSCPYGQPGDLLWVREKFAKTMGVFEPEICYSFFADDFHWSWQPGDVPHGKLSCQWHDADLSKEVKWKPSIHMPKAAARIWLEITEVKVERVQDISEEDAIAEGIIPLLASSMQLKTQGQLYFDYTKPKQIFNEGIPPFWSFNSLWCSINGGESWDANPWVWVVKYKVISTTGKPSFDYAQDDKTTNQ